MAEDLTGKTFYLVFKCQNCGYRQQSVAVPAYRAEKFPREIEGSCDCQLCRCKKFVLDKMFRDEVKVQRYLGGKSE